MKQPKNRIAISTRPSNVYIPRTAYSKKRDKAIDVPLIYLDEAPVVLGSEESESAVDLMLNEPDVIEEKE